MDLDDQSPDDQAAGSSLRDAALKGVRWMAIGRFIVEIGTLLSSVALARLVRPDEFGAVAPTALLIAVGGTLSTGSFGTPLVRAEVLTRKLVQTALALSLLTGAAVSALIIVGAQVIDLGYTEHQVHLIQVVAPTFFLFSIGAVSQALIERELDFRRSALNEVGSILPSTIATVIMAAMGLQGLALAIGYLVMAGCSSLQAIWWKPPPLPWIQAGKIREIVGFGLFASGSSILYAMQRTIGYGILGARLNATSAGYYYRATQLGVEYQAKVTQILLRMLFPLLSRAETPEQMRSVRARMVQVHTAFLFPLLAMLVVLAPVLVPWLYGSEWAGASEATQILAIVGFATVVNTGTGPVLLAAGRPRALLVKDGIELPALIAVLVIAAPHGLITACWAVAAFRLVSLVANQYFLLDRICGIPIKDTLVRDVVPAATASAIAAGAALLVHHRLDAAPAAPALADMAATSIVGLFVYAVAMRLLFARTWEDCTAVLQRLRPASRQRAAAVATPLTPALDRGIERSAELCSGDKPLASVAVVTSSAASAAAVLDPAPRALATAARTGDTAPHTAVEKPGSGVKLLNVQALRAIAALSVVFCHLGSADGLEEKYLQGRTLMRFYATPGQMGVDLFFVISGFIMTVTTWNLVTSRATSRKFFVRRVKRIYPIYWVLTAPVLAIWLFNSDLVNPGAAHASQPIQSLLLLPQAGDPFIAAGWTLVFEMYFYAVFSLVLLAPRRFIPWIVGAWATVTLVFGIFFYLQWHLPVVYVVSNPMVLEFVFGIVVGYVIMQRRKFPALPTLLLGTVALITAMVLIGRKGDIGLDSWQRMAFAGIPCAFILAGAVGLERSKRFVAPHIMQVLGDSSYAIYLVHGLVFALAGRAIIHVVPDSLNKPLHIPLMLGVAAGATLIGVAIHYWIERPLLVRIGGRRAPALQPAVSPAAS